ncbi:MAG TPA: ATP-binding protein [Kofleriaceae bacterium]|jgi:nitrogen fixation/metabolism regulation signal transduction histidine kinase
MATKHFPLRLKAVVLFVLLVSIPLATAYMLVGQLGRAAANVASSDAAARIDAMDKAIHRYHDLVNMTKRLQSEIAERLAKRNQIAQLDEHTDLAAIIADPSQAGLRAIAMLRPDGSVIAEADRAPSGNDWRDKVVDQPIGDSGASLRLTFEVSASLQSDLQELKEAIDGTRTVSQIQSALPQSYQTTFIIVIGLASVIAAAAGIIATTSLTRRIDVLVTTSRRVSDGHTDARSDIRGRDEVGELGTSFDGMLDTIDESRRQVEYLQRMGVWQDVARRLAHEIKNPLTPIQLAVQQCVSAYRGTDTDPTKFKKLLTDTGEIVEEEIEGLRRLVDTFRTLGALPKVEASPISLAEVIEELKLDPTMATRLTLTPPNEAVTVRADKLLLKRVLANLVENGIHAGQEAGASGDVVIGWGSDARGDVVTITVDDHGKGVAPDKRTKIFEPYVTTKATGTGLGLAISRKIAIEHGGELSIANEPAPTGGARFVVSLPLRGPDSSLG